MDGCNIMYGCSDAAVVYGTFDGKSEHVLDREWLYCNFPNVEIFAGTVIRNHLACPIYGVACHMDEQGKVHLPDKEKMDELTRFLNMLRETDENKDATLSYHLGVMGDWDICDTVYELSEHSSS